VKRLALAALVLLTACSGAPDPGAQPADSSAPSARATDHPVPIVAEALAATAGEPGVDVTEILSGGPPPDGIPAVDDPVIVPADEADESLVESEQVLLVEHEGEARAYPLRSLVRHEIVNDVLGGLPVAATWCPLCNTGVAFDRNVPGGGVTTFGVSGTLYRSAMVMFDRETRSLWAQPSGTAVLGERTGTRLSLVSSSILPWSEARAVPGVTVALADRSELDAATNPYQGYDTSDEPFLFRGRIDPRLPAFERVAGVSFDGDARAWSYALLAQERVVTATVGGQPLVMFWASGSSSALDTRDITEGREIGATGVYEPDGQSFTADPEGFRSGDGTLWSLGGLAVSGPQEGEQLERLPSQDAFWFAWAAFNPETVLTS